MDKLDEWMNKTLSGSSAGSGDSSKNPEKKSDDKPSGSKPQQKNNNHRPKPSHNKKKQSHGKQQHGKNSGKKPAHKPAQKKVLGTGKRKLRPSTNIQLKEPHTLRDKLRVIPLGGLDEVGKNMMAFEYEDDIIIVDMGFEFPSQEMYGIDYIIPDVSYLENKKKRIRGVIITHAHLDHIGGIPYMMPRLDFPPMYGTKLTMGMVEKRIEEFDQKRYTKLNTIHPDDTIKLGKFTVTFFRVTHSIPDCVAAVIDTPAGKVVMTGDYKFDDQVVSPFEQAEVGKMEALGKEGKVLAMFGDSTNSLKPGHSLTSTQVTEALDKAVGEVEGRLIIATFSSQIGRLEQILQIAHKHNRKVYVSGRSMQTNLQIAMNLGYVKVPKGLVQDIKFYRDKTPDHETMIVTTGSQGEERSALARIASDTHASIKLKKDDTVILSSSPIIGNELAIAKIINKLCKRGAHVVHNQIREVHTSGHGYQDEIIRMINLIKPKYLVPVHGEYFMRQGQADLAIEKCGYNRDNVVMIENGDVLHISDGKVEKSKEKIQTDHILIDGHGEGHAGSQVQSDRKIMANHGILTVLIYIDKKSRKVKRDPDIVARGFVYMHEMDEIVGQLSKEAINAYKTIQSKNPGAKRGDIKRYVRQKMDKFADKALERRPLIMPLLVEV